MKLLVTGATGMLGRRLVADASAAGHEVVGIGSADAPLEDAEALAKAVAAASPQAVINCAAYTNVDGAEADRAEVEADAQLATAVERLLAPAPVEVEGVAGHEAEASRAGRDALTGTGAGVGPRASAPPPG